jgi:predicted nucleic acid-binding protein
MDLADASILILAMKTGIRSVVSFDSDFEVYRLPDKKRLRNLLTHS